MEREVQDPIALFKEAFSRAQAQETGDPTAMSLATVDASGRPSVRIVLLKEVDERGFVFYTNESSRKGHDLAQNPRAALCLHWPVLKRQVRVEGRVDRVSAAEADAYFRTRPRGSQIGAWASRQSQKLPARQELLDRCRETEERFAGTEIPRPPFWGGYRVVADAIEFWQGDEFRLHHRTLFSRTPAGWKVDLLYP